MKATKEIQRSELEKNKWYSDAPFDTNKRLKALPILLKFERRDKEENLCCFSEQNNIDGTDAHYYDTYEKEGIIFKYDGDPFYEVED